MWKGDSPRLGGSPNMPEKYIKTVAEVLSIVKVLMLELDGK